LLDDVSTKLSDPERPRRSTLTEAAEKYGVSERQIKDAGKLRKDDPELADAVRDGTMSLPAAKRKAKAKAGESPAGAGPGAEPEGTAPAGKKAAAGKTKRVKIIIESRAADAFAEALGEYTIKDPDDIGRLAKPAKSLAKAQGAALAKALVYEVGLMPAWVLCSVAYQILDGMFRGPGVKVCPWPSRRSEPQRISSPSKATPKTDAGPADGGAGDGADGPA
jgi:hypothetical protein